MSSRGGGRLSLPTLILPHPHPLTTPLIPPHHSTTSRRHHCISHHHCHVTSPPSPQLINSCPAINSQVKFKFVGENPPDNLPTFLFSLSNVPYVSAFVAARNIKLQLASEAHLSELNPQNIAKINAGGFDLVESPELRASCTVICKYVDRSLLAKPSESLHSEISDKNGVKASITKTKFALKIRCATPQEANKLLTNGVKAFSIFIPSHYCEFDQWFNIIQCHKCYKYGHETKTCTAPQICSKCSEEGHFYTHCSKSTSTCPNCQGPHTAISGECPSRKHLLKNARLNHGLAHTHPTNTPAQPTYTTTNTPHTSAYSYATAARLPIPRPSPSHSSSMPPPLMEPTSCARMTGCIQAAYLKAGQDFQVFSKLLPEILAYNNLPNIKIPPSWLGQQQHPSPPPTPNAPPTHLPPPPTPSPIPPASQPQTTSNNSPCTDSHHHPPDMSPCKRRSTSPSPVRRSEAMPPPPRHHQTDQGRPLRGPQ
ncbi:hypothetical protein Pcinc_011031 [Petrolisthes cinctipes]|uniref:CCHC-type domain-containing protein n=1 Tax=Petrolisthes cinctipes TaxID=88211 RepID=A0AAE1G1M2_PETCI|nr:hypothetical protein Pcinc_011031 [Petrolisthes cinctipes]